MSWEPFFVGGVAINRDPTMNESRSCNYDDICVYMCDIARGQPQADPSLHTYNDDNVIIRRWMSGMRDRLS
jgi:hypothetical protein